MVIDITPAPILSKGWGTPTNAALETLAAQAQTADEVAAIASSVADAKFAEVSVDLVDATMTATAETPSSDFAQHLNGTIGAAVSPLVEAALAASGAVGVSIVTAEGVDLALSTNYGVEAGVPFYNLDGVGMDQAALLAIDPTSASGFSLVQIGA